jgi:hypothetical protein
MLLVCLVFIKRFELLWLPSNIFDVVRIPIPLDEQEINFLLQLRKLIKYSSFHRRVKIVLSETESDRFLTPLKDSRLIGGFGGQWTVCGLSRAQLFDLLSNRPGPVEIFLF